MDSSHSNLTVITRLVLLIEVLAALLSLQESWGDLCVFSDEMQFGDLPNNLRLVLPRNSLLDSALPLALITFVLVWQLVGSLCTFVMRTDIGRILAILQCQIGIIGTSSFWLEAIKRMNAPHVPATVVPNSPRFIVGCLSAVIVYVVTESVLMLLSKRSRKGSG